MGTFGRCVLSVDLSVIIRIDNRIDPTGCSRILHSETKTARLHPGLDVPTLHTKSTVLVLTSHALGVPLTSDLVMTFAGLVIIFIASTHAQKATGVKLGTAFIRRFTNTT